MTHVDALLVQTLYRSARVYVSDVGVMTDKDLVHTEHIVARITRKAYQRANLIHR